MFNELLEAQVYFSCLHRIPPELRVSFTKNIFFFTDISTGLRISFLFVFVLLLSPFEVKGAMNPLREIAAKEMMDNKFFKRLSDDILPHILRLYGSSATARDFDIYAPNATFEDPLMCAHGVKQIKSAFYSLGKIFSESKIVEYTVQENFVSPGKGEILIDNRQHYKIMGKTVDMISLIKLDVEGGKIIRHEDRWDKKPLWNRDTVSVPLVGRFVEMSRRGSMLTTHLLMRFGKDPSH